MITNEMGGWGDPAQRREKIRLSELSQAQYWNQMSGMYQQQLNFGLQNSLGNLGQASLFTTSYATNTTTAPVEEDSTATSAGSSLRDQMRKLMGLK